MSLYEEMSRAYLANYNLSGECCETIEEAQCQIRDKLIYKFIGHDRKIREAFGEVLAGRVFIPYKGSVAINGAACQSYSDLIAAGKAAGYIAGLLGRPYSLLRASSVPCGVALGSILQCAQEARNGARDGGLVAGTGWSSQAPDDDPTSTILMGGIDFGGFAPEHPQAIVTLASEDHNKSEMKFAVQSTGHEEVANLAACFFPRLPSPPPMPPWIGVTPVVDPKHNPWMVRFFANRSRLIDTKMGRLVMVWLGIDLSLVAKVLQENENWKSYQNVSRS
jgi:hypothetical protein